MAALQDLSGAVHNKISKSKPKMAVKPMPILKKLSHSERNSLDLDRSWEEQDDGWGTFYDGGSSGRSARDVAFSSYRDAAFNGTGTGAVAGGGSSRKFHTRSTSGTSVVSSGSGGPRSGPFIHPFQQTPRTSSPPLLSRAQSKTSLKSEGGAEAGTVNGSVNHNPVHGLPNVVSKTNSLRDPVGVGNRDYSPTITENASEEAEPRVSNSYSRSISNHFHHHHTHHQPPSGISQSSLPRTSLTSQRPSPKSEATSPGPGQLRINTFPGRSTPGPSSRLGLGILNHSNNNSDLHLNQPVFESPTVTSTPPLGPSLAGPAISSPSTMSPLRNSFDGLGIPRLRSRSEVDTASRAEHIRQARKRFEERERAKADKWEREQIRKQERKGTKEASRLERAAAAQIRKNSGGIVSAGAVDEAMRPAASRKSTGGSGSSRTSISGMIRKKSGPDATALGAMDGSGSGSEKNITFSSNSYAAVPGGMQPQFGPGVDDVHFKTPKRTNTAKKKTQGYWTGFILWLRTRLLRLGRRD